MDKQVKRRRRVGICGSRLVISAISASLQENPAVEVQIIDDLLPNIIEEPDAASPDVILFDIATAPPQFAVRLVNAHPAITLIGVDLAKNEMLVLYGRQRRFLTAEDLMQAIQLGPQA